MTFNPPGIIYSVSSLSSVLMFIHRMFRK